MSEGGSEFLRAAKLAPGVPRHRWPEGQWDLLKVADDLDEVVDAVQGLGFRV